MLRAKALLVASVCGLVGTLGCNDTTAPQSELDGARAKWAANGYTTYAFTMRRLCYCAITEPIRVTVSNNRIVAATLVANGAPVDTVYAESINSLFDFIDYGIAHHYAMLNVTYDPQRGFPTNIGADGSEMVADDEVTYTISDVTPVSIALSKSPF